MAGALVLPTLGIGQPVAASATVAPANGCWSVREPLGTGSRCAMDHCNAPQRPTAGSAAAQRQPSALLHMVVTKCCCGVPACVALGSSTEKIASLQGASEDSKTRTRVTWTCSSHKA